MTITTTGGVNFSVDGSPIVTPPGTDTTATTWTPTYESSGLLALAERTNATAITIPGSHTLDVHLTGVKSGSDTFGAGVYAGTVIVRCE
ncbi:hypothetical protein [Fulvimarina pelagi]|uniref:hypothetical protein n=1 Tax=Fulvimarina pelagi TaxID=217511 RepID=UPI0002E3F87F|nr:hypothetical protein [Fulvimarina pelagi]